MTVTVNGTSHHITPGDELQGCVRAPDSAVETADRPPTAAGSECTPVHARVIPADPPVAKVQPTPKVGNFASPHLREVRAAVRGSWPLTESPQPLAVVARQVFPGKGEAANTAVWIGMTLAGLFRLSVFGLAQLVQLAVATRIRAGVALALLVLAVAAGCVAH